MAETTKSTSVRVTTDNIIVFYHGTKKFDSVEEALALPDSFFEQPATVLPIAKIHIKKDVVNLEDAEKIICFGP